MKLETNDDGLKRVVGIWGLGATVVNFSIGAGIYALPAIIGIHLGPAGIIGYLLCALMFVAIVLCYVEIGSKFKTSGGSYAYVERAFGPFAGFVINWLFFFGWGVLSDAAIVNLVADSLSVIFPAFSEFWFRAFFFAVVLGAITILNVVSAKGGLNFVKFITLIKLLPLLAIIIGGFSKIHPENLQIKQFPSIHSFGETALILFFAFAGFETALNVGGEIKNPKRTIPRGVLLGGIIVLLIYLLIQSVMQGVLGDQVVDFKNSALAEVAKRSMGPIGATIVVFAAVVSGIGAVGGDIFASSRLLFAGATDGLFPKFLGKIHTKYGTPYWSVIVFSLMIFIFSIAGGFKQLAVLASGTLLIIYLAVILAMIKIRREPDIESENTFKIPGGLIVPSMAIVAILWVLSNLTSQESVSITIFLAVICLVYWAQKFLIKKPSST